MSRFGSTEGRGAIKLIITIVVVALVANAAYKYMKQRVAHAELQDATLEYMKFAGVKEPPWQAEDIKAAVLAKAKDLEIPLKPENVMVSEDGNMFRARITYDRPYKIPGYEKKIHWESDQSWNKY